MNRIHALTRLEPIDGLRIRISFQQSPMFRIGGTWNYTNIERPNFNLCAAVFNPKPDTTSAHFADFLSAEYSSIHGSSFAGSWAPFPAWGCVVKAEGRTRDFKSLGNMYLKGELRQILKSVHLSVSQSTESLAISALHRPLQNLSYGIRAETLVLRPSSTQSRPAGCHAAGQLAYAMTTLSITSLLSTTQCSPTLSTSGTYTRTVRRSPLPRSMP